MVERSHPALSVVAQYRLLPISRSSFYHAPRGETEMNLALLQLIDRQFPETPFYRVTQMTWHLRSEDHAVNVKRIRRLMRLMVKGTVAPVGPRKPPERCRSMQSPAPASPRKGKRPTLPAGGSTQPSPVR